MPRVRFEGWRASGRYGPVAPVRGAGRRWWCREQSFASAWSRRLRGNGRRGTARWMRRRFDGGRGRAKLGTRDQGASPCVRTRGEPASRRRSGVRELGKRIGRPRATGTASARIRALPRCKPRHARHERPLPRTLLGRRPSLQAPDLVGRRLADGGRFRVQVRKSAQRSWPRLPCALCEGCCREEASRRAFASSTGSDQDHRCPQPRAGDR